MKRVCFLIMLLIVVVSETKAQCSGATTLTTDGSWLGSTTFTTNEQWHKFTADQSTYIIYFTVQNYTASAHQFTLYENNCSSFTVISTTTLTSEGETVRIDVSGLTATNDYLLKIINGNSPTAEVYNVAISSVPIPTCPGVTTCELVRNGDFESNNGCGPITTTLGPYCWDYLSPNPDLFLTGCTTGTGLANPYCAWLGSCTYSSNPTINSYSASSNAIVGLAQYLYSAESIRGSLTAPLVAGQSYYLSFRAMQYDGTYKDGSPAYTNYTTSTIGSTKLTFCAGTFTQVYGNYPSPSDVIIKTATLNPVGNIWGFYNYTFTYPIGAPNATGIAVGLHSNLNYPGTAMIFTLIDDISIISASLAPTFTLPPNICTTQSLANLSQYATPNTGTFSGAGVTYSSGIYYFNAAGNLAAGIYTVLYNAYNGAGCNIPTSATIQVGNTSSVIDFTVSSNLSCSSNQVTITAAPSSTAYLWSPANAGNPIVVTPTATSTYTTLGIIGSCTLTGTVSVPFTTLTPANFSLSVNSSSLCYSQTNTLSLTGPGALTVTWNPGNSTNNPYVTTQSTTTTYTASISSLGCNVTNTVNVTFTPGPSPTFSINATSNPVCLTGTTPVSATLSASDPGLTYTWQPGAATGSSIVITPTASTVFTVSATSSIGCNGSQSYSVAVSSSCCTSSVVAAFNSLVFPSSPFGNSYTVPLIFNADVTVPSGQNIWLARAGFQFAPGVQLIVSPGATLSTEDAHLYACGSNMWKGIVVQDGGVVQTFSANLTYGNLLEDAEIAINASSQTTSTQNPILNLHFTTFNKNNIGIKFDGYQQQNGTYPLQILDCIFTSRNFTFSPSSWPSALTTTPGLRSTVTGTTSLLSPYELQSAAAGTLLPPYSGTVANSGIQLNNIGITSGTVYYSPVIGSTVSTSDFNLFDNLVYGIKSTNSNLKCINSVFQNGVTSTLNAPGTGIYFSASSASNFKLDLYSGSNNLSLGNRFWNCPNGISVNKAYEVNCRYAIFRSTQINTITPTLYTPGNRAIDITTNRFLYELSDNTFNNIGTGIRLIIQSGQYVSGGSTLTGVYANNISIQNNYIGAQLTSTAALGSAYVNQGITISSAINFTWSNVANTGLYINQNTIDRAYRGINVIGIRNYPSSIVNNTIKLTDDALFNAPQKGIYIANNMLTMVVSTNSLQATGNTNTLVSLVYSGLGANHIVNCNDLRSANRGFEFIGSQPGAVWKGNTMQPMPVGYALVTGGVIGTQGATTSPIDNQWSGTWTGYSQTYVDATSDSQFSKIWVQSSGSYSPSLNNEGAIGVGYNNGNINGTTGSYSCGAANPPPNMIVPNTNSLTNGMAHISNDVLYRYLFLNPDSINGSSTLQTFVNSFSLTSLDYFMRIETALYNNDPSTASSLMSSVSPTNVVETNTKIFYQLYIDYLNNSFDATDSTNLHEMKDYCPGLYGSWVYQARALYDEIYGLTSPPEPDCLDFPPAGRAFHDPSRDSSNISVIATDVILPLRQNLAIKETDKWNAAIFPNPAKADLKISSSRNNEFISMRIEDSQGRLVENDLIEIKNHSAAIQLDLPSGIYFVTLTNKDNQIVVQKLFISK